MNTGSSYLLLVEDDPDILKFLDTALTFSGYRVITARNGKEGLEIIKKERPAIVIADIMMPKLDGFGLVHRLRIDPDTRNIPVVFITATYVAPEDKEFALNIGATRFIQKPVALQELLSTITELSQHHAPIVLEPLGEYNFYNGYRKRLETKLGEKNRQIARDELLLGIQANEKDPFIQASLLKAKHERDEMILLLEQVLKQLDKIKKSGKNHN
jgi:DNA-binding response OmpR family regulator